MTPSTTSTSHIIPSRTATIRHPTTTDASAIWRTARDAGTLDLNSPYAYLLLCHHHADACLVADAGDGLAGFVVGYRPPAAPDTTFVWQVAVAASHRGSGLAGRLLDRLLAAGAGHGVRHLEATVTPSNEASRRLFTAVAERHGARLEVRPLFTGLDFPEDGHEDELLYRIGPVTTADA